MVEATAFRLKGKAGYTTVAVKMLKGTCLGSTHRWLCRTSVGAPGDRPKPPNRALVAVLAPPQEFSMAVLEWLQSGDPSHG